MRLMYRARWLVLGWVWMAAVGCAPNPSLIRPDFDARASAIQQVTVLPPDVRVYLVSAGGVVEQMDEETDRAQALVSQVTEAVMRRETRWVGQWPSLDSLEQAAPEALQETQGLFDAVNASMQRHAYGEPREKLKTLRSNFDVTVGPEAAGLAAPGSDALLFIWAVDYRATAGRQALKVGAAVAGALFGVAVVPMGEPTGLSLALVEPSSGDVLWYTHVRAQGGKGLGSQASTEQMIRTALRRLPTR